MQDFYINFLNNLRQVELNYVTLEFEKDITSELKKFVQMLERIKYEEGFIHCFYGQIKEIVNAFVRYWAETMNIASNVEDKSFTCEEIAYLFNKSFEVVEEKNEQFKNEFDDKYNKKSNELNEKYEQYKYTLSEMKDTIDSLNNRKDKCSILPTIMKAHIKTFVKKTHSLLDCAHTAIALKILEYEYKIRMSLEEMLTKTKRNLLTLEENVSTRRNDIVCQLYEKNKELLHAMRKSKNTEKITNVDVEINKIVRKITEEPSECVSIEKLKAEMKFWEKQMTEFKSIKLNLDKLDMEINKVGKQIGAYDSVRETEYKGTKRCCWKNIGVAFREKRKYLKEKYIETAKAYVTHFAVRGPNETFFKDDLGSYYKDIYGHQVYVHYYGLNKYHKKCDGNLVEYPQIEKFYQDENGSYYKNSEGEKIYTAASCSSSYKLKEDGTFVKVSEDCGHGDAKTNCKIGVSQGANIISLPDNEEIDIKGTLNKEMIDYLWKMAGVITMSLKDVGTLRPKNPIQYFAHRLLENKYSNAKEAKEEQKLADQFRNKIYEARKKKIQAQRDLWKSKQVKRRLPEESDDVDIQRELYFCMVQMHVSLQSQHLN